MKFLFKIIILIFTTLATVSCLTKSKLPVSDFATCKPITDLNGTYLSGNPKFGGNLNYYLESGTFSRDSLEIEKVNLKFDGKDSLFAKFYSANNILVKEKKFKGQIVDNYFEKYLTKTTIPFFPIYFGSIYTRIRMGVTNNNNLLFHFWHSSFGGILCFYGGYDEDRSKTFSRIESFKTDNGYSFESDGKWGFKSNSDTIIIPAQYDVLTTFDSLGIARVRLDKKWALIDKNGLLKTAIEYSYIEPYDKQLGGYEVSVGNTWEVDLKYGLINSEGRIIIPTIYNYISSTNIKNLVRVSNNYNGYYLDGEMICPPILNLSSYNFEYIKLEGSDPNMKYLEVIYDHNYHYLGLDGYLYPIKQGILKKSKLLFNERIEAKSLVNH